MILTLVFSFSENQVEQVGTMDPHPSSKVPTTTLATQVIASSTRNVKADAEREVTVTTTKVTGSLTGIVTDTSTLSRLLSSLKGLIEDYDGLDLLSSLYAEPLSQLAGPKASVTL